MFTINKSGVPRVVVYCIHPNKTPPAFLTDTDHVYAMSSKHIEAVDAFTKITLLFGQGPSMHVVQLFVHCCFIIITERSVNNGGQASIFDVTNGYGCYNYIDYSLSKAMHSIKCFETRDTKEKLRLNCGVAAELCHSALARSESDLLASRPYTRDSGTHSIRDTGLISKA